LKLKRMVTQRPAVRRAATTSAAHFTRLLARADLRRVDDIIRSLRWRLPTDIGQVSFINEGIRFHLDLRDNLQSDLYFWGSYEGHVHRLLLSELRAGDVFIDVGANVGVHALAAARALEPLGGHVLAFEPEARAAAELERAARDNGVNAITIERVALGAWRGRAELRSSVGWHTDDLGVLSLHGDGDLVSTVDVVPFDEWWNENKCNRIDLLKIDVEGAEVEVLQGMEKTLARHRPRLIVVEVVETLLRRAGTSAAELEGLLTAYRYDPEGPSIRDLAAGPGGPYWPNAILRPVAH
jgi:FkbM family methyltransferase